MRWWYVPSGRSCEPGSTRMSTPIKHWKTGGRNSATRHAVYCVIVDGEIATIPCSTKGMRKLDTPPPRLPQPAVVALTSATMHELNIELVQKVLPTTTARLMPVMHRQTMKVALFVVHAIAKLAGAVMSNNDAMLSRGPNWSHTGPRNVHITAVPTTLATFAVLISTSARFSASRVMGRRAATANVEKNELKYPSVASQNARWCGASDLHTRNTSDMCCTSTGTRNFAADDDSLSRSTFCFAFSCTCLSACLTSERRRYARFHRARARSERSSSVRR
mmetsp:Transcript_15430/g.39056  ORF Transcript_15430/g.39056 Transcript_15430/m.39056 type:complete len:277 (-) Transcript_15430:128-958(-)